MLVCMLRLRLEQAGWWHHWKIWGSLWLWGLSQAAPDWGRRLCIREVASMARDFIPGPIFPFSELWHSGYLRCSDTSYVLRTRILLILLVLWRLILRYSSCSEYWCSGTLDALGMGTPSVPGINILILLVLWVLCTSETPAPLGTDTQILSMLWGLWYFTLLMLWGLKYYNTPAALGLWYYGTPEALKIVILGSSWCSGELWMGLLFCVRAQTQQTGSLRMR